MLHELGIEPFALVAHDYGALVACELLARDPRRVRHLTITNTSLRPSDWRGGSPASPLRLLKVRPLGEIAFALARPFMLKLAFSVYVSERNRLGSGTMALYWAPFEEGFSRTVLQLFRSPSLASADFRRWQDTLAGYPGRALVVWGALDPTFGLDRGREIAALWPSARFEIFEHSNHFIPEDRPRALARLIAAEVRQAR